VDPKQKTINLHAITISDTATGQKFTVQTVRTAQEIAEYVDESEKDEVVDTVQGAVSEAFRQKKS
jgi:hypothetical protein